MKNRVVFLVCTFVVLMAVASAALLALDNKSDKGKPEPPAAVVHWAKGQSPGGPFRNSSPNLVDHHGGTMPSVSVTPIYWGTSWTSSNPKIAGLQSFYAGMSGSDYSKTTDEFSGGASNTITVNSAFVDATPAANGNNTSTILTEVCKVITNPDPTGNGYYPVYVDIARGHAGYCAWHSASTCGGYPVQFAFFFNLDGDAGCDPQDTSNLHQTVGLAALANVSGHEISEARTDPRLNAWYDNSGAENSDKCAWTFGTSLLTLSNGSQWKIQGNWSNAAYNAGTGYANSSGQKGCIDGGNYK